MNVYRDMGLVTLRIGKLYISNGWSCSNDWTAYYKNKRPWRNWSRNPFYKKITYENGRWTRTVFFGFIFTKLE